MIEIRPAYYIGNDTYCTCSFYLIFFFILFFAGYLGLVASKKTEWCAQDSLLFSPTLHTVSFSKLSYKTSFVVVSGKTLTKGKSEERVLFTPWPNRFI